MAKDMNGRELRVGDSVILHGVVHSMRRDDDAANLTIETAHTAPNTKDPHRVTLSSTQVEKADNADGTPKQAPTKRKVQQEESDR